MIKSYTRVARVFLAALMFLLVTSTAWAQLAPGTMVKWGTANGPVDFSIPAGLTDVKAIAAGSGHAVVLKGDGTVEAFGLNNHGQSNVPAGLSGVTAVAAGWFHSLALRADGTVAHWGNTVDAGTPPAGLTGVIAISSFGYGSLALTSNGTVVGWGSFAGASVPAGLSGVKAIGMGMRPDTPSRWTAALSCGVALQPTPGSARCPRAFPMSRWRSAATITRWR